MQKRAVRHMKQEHLSQVAQEIYKSWLLEHTKDWIRFKNKPTNKQKMTQRPNGRGPLPAKDVVN